ncbi:MAG: hypothetical protein SO007_05010 [Candidatus Enteromonas sp.]|nr:hypothetical protein [Candidatus Enteromonas sp.]
MKRFLVSILVPAAAAIAVVGSGFSVWYFGDKQVDTKSNASLKVENMLHIGTFETVSDKFKLHLDQTAETRAKIVAAGDELLGLEATGITLTNETSATSTIKYKQPSTPQVDHGPFGETTVKVKIVTTVEVKNDLNKWVVPTGLTAATGTVTTGYTGYDLVWSDDQVTNGLELTTAFTFAYAPYVVATHYGTAADQRKGVTTCEPINSTEYATMKTAVEAIDKPMKIVTRATIVKVA